MRYVLSERSLAKRNNSSNMHETSTAKHMIFSFSLTSFLFAYTQVVQTEPKNQWNRKRKKSKIFGCRFSFARNLLSLGPRATFEGRATYLRFATFEHLVRHVRHQPRSDLIEQHTFSLNSHFSAIHSVAIALLMMIRSINWSRKIEASSTFSGFHDFSIFAFVR